MKKRIALISDHASPLAEPGGVDSGGQNIYVSQLATILADRGHQVDVFTRRTNSGDALVAERGYRVIHIPAGPPRPVPKEELLQWMPAFGSEAIAFMREQDCVYDIVHAHFWMSGLVAERIRRELGIPYVITFHALGAIRRSHQGSADTFPAERLIVERQLVRRADRIVATCPSELEELTTLYEADPQKIRVIPCGFDPEEMQATKRHEARARLGWAGNEFVVLHVGRIVPRKGIDNLIRGYARWWKASGAKSRLVIAGGETRNPDLARHPEFRRLAEIAKEEGCRYQVAFLGQRSRRELPDLYSAADLFITTPLYEPFGITPLEAMACGTPVIASSVGGLKFSVIDGKTGSLVPPAQPSELATRIDELYRNHALRRDYARQGRARAYECFPWSLLIPQIESVYLEVGALGPLRNPNRTGSYYFG